METPEQHSPIGPDHQIAAPAPVLVRHRHKIIWIVLGLLVLALLVAFLLIRRHDQAVAKAEAAAKAKTVGIAITTVTATKGNIGVYLDSIGTVTAVYTDSITSQVDGLITEVHYTEVSG
jgi:membrane fusion protein, multidrug efflux system